MPDERVLILYATKHGHTRKVAEKLATVLQSRGLTTELLDLSNRGADFRLDNYSAVILGGPVYAGRFMRPLRSFVAENCETLAKMPTAFFSVGLSAAKNTPKDERDARDAWERFSADTGFKTAQVGLFAGALSYSSYSFFLRFFMKLAARPMAQDTSHDYDFTNWQTVQSFADTFANRLESLRPTPPWTQPPGEQPRA
jgi:menaquinone-dependent protoporphyrinogen oxidase